MKKKSNVSDMNDALAALNAAKAEIESLRRLQIAAQVEVRKAQLSVKQTTRYFVQLT